MLRYKSNYIEYCSYKQYGIDVLHNGKLIKSYYDITENYDDISELINMCNSLEIDLCHIDDIIEDYLTDFQI